MPIKFAADTVAFLTKKKALLFPFYKVSKVLEEKSKPTPRLPSYVLHSKALHFAALLILTCKERSTLLKPS